MSGKKNVGVAIARQVASKDLETTDFLLKKSLLCHSFSFVISKEHTNPSRLVANVRLAIVDRADDSARVIRIGPE